MHPIVNTNGLRALAVAAVLALGVTGALAQTETGRITGTVTRAGGERAAKARIVAKSIENGLVRKTTANDHGTYSLSNVKPGLYEVTFEADGAKPKREKIRVTVGTPFRLDAQLDAASEVRGTPSE